MEGGKWRWSYKVALVTAEDLSARLWFITISGRRTEIRGNPLPFHRITKTVINVNQIENEHVQNHVILVLVLSFHNISSVN